MSDHAKQSSCEREFSVRRNIRSCWYLSGCSDRFIPAARYIEGFREVAIEAEGDWTKFPVHNWIMVLDEFSVGLSLLFSGLASGERDPNSPDTIFNFMIGALAGHMHAVRTLVVAGFDVQARILTRTLCEHIDIILLIRDDENLARIYKDHADPDLSNSFWHKYASRRKIRKSIMKSVKQEHPGIFEAYKSIDEYFQNEEAILGVSVHPSYLSSVMIPLNGVATGFKNAGMFGVMDSASVRILSLIFFRMFELFMVCHKKIEGMIEKCDVFNHVITQSQAKERLKFLGVLSAYFALNNEILPMSYREPHVSQSGK